MTPDTFVENLLEEMPVEQRELFWKFVEQVGTECVQEYKHGQKEGMAVALVATVISATIGWTVTYAVKRAKKKKLMKELSTESED